MRSSTHLLLCGLVLFGYGLLSTTGCRPAPPESIPLPTKICVRVQHHHQPIAKATVYIKYNTDTFPGYTKPASYFDRKVIAGADARACFAPVPEGTHWLVGFGYDSLYFPHDVFGSMKIKIELGKREVVDTIFYVSE